MKTNQAANPMHQINQFVAKAGITLQQLARDNSRLTHEHVKLSMDLVLAQEEAAFYKVAHKYASDGRISWEAIPRWVQTKLSAYSEGSDKNAQWYENALSATADLSPADLRGGRPNRSANRKQSSPTDNTVPALSNSTWAMMRSLDEI